MRAAVYCRLSKEDAFKTDAARESESIRNQRSMLVRYAVEHGYTVVQIYADEDFSGADRSRPAFNAMLRAAERHEFDVILAKTQSRFTRDMELVEKYLHGKFAEWGIRFIAVVDHADTQDEAGKKLRQINGLINEWYLEDLSANIRAVLDHKRRSGVYIATNALYGYKKDPRNKGHLLVDAEAAAVVRRVYTLCLQGYGSAQIARLLTREGIPNPTQYRRLHGGAAVGQKNTAAWGRATVCKMLHNRTYTGDLVQGRSRRASYKSAKTVSLPRGEWIVVPNTHEGIIDRETFARVQRLTAERARQKNRCDVSATHVG